MGSHQDKNTNYKQGFSASLCIFPCRCDRALFGSLSPDHSQRFSSHLQDEELRSDQHCLRCIFFPIPHSSSLGFKPAGLSLIIGQGRQVDDQTSKERYKNPSLISLHRWAFRQQMHPLN